MPRLSIAGCLLAAALPLAPALATETYYTDQGHTEVRFSWSHAGVSIQTGEFTSARGVLQLDPENVEQSAVEVTIDAASVSTGFTPLDDHLKSADFLEVESYPEITFTSTAITRTGENTAEIVGDLTIHGITKPVTLQAALTHRGEHPFGALLDIYKGQWVAFAATTEIDHMEFNVGPFSTGPISIEIVTEMRDWQD